MTFAEKIISFLKKLSLDPGTLPAGIAVMNPFVDKKTFAITRQFYTKFYSDNNPRTMIFGINPGRFGGGITGVPFTDPIKLERFCDIKNDLQKKAELSADFIYRMIQAYGGPEKFYREFYITAVSPLGFTKDNKNLNYYDVKELQEGLGTFIIDTIKKQLKFGVNTNVCYCLGEGENFKFLTKLNAKHNFFETIVPLAHPRFIMQYKRKKVDSYIADYLSKFASHSS